MFRLLVVVILLSALVIFKVNSAKILCVYPTPSLSHQIVYRSLTRALAERGHEVVVITTHPFPPGESPANVTELDMYEVSYHLWKDAVSKVYHETSDPKRITGIYLDMFTSVFENQIRSKAVQSLILNQKASFDLLVLECNVLSTLGLISVFGAPAIQTSTFGPTLESYSTFGASNQPFLFPTCISHRFYNLTFWEAINNLYRIVVQSYTLESHERVDHEMLQRNLGFAIPPISKLREKVNAFLQTVYPIWVNNPPVPRSIVYLGGLHEKPANILPQNLQTFLDSSENGVIYVSFGTNVHPSLLCQEKINTMGRVFSNLPYEILWLRDENIWTESAKNIKIAKWVPQSDLLHHPKIKLFITQGGLQSTEEGITAGIPLIGIPIFGDQWLHTENYVRLKIGLQLDWNKLSEEKLTTSIVRVIGDKSYKANVLRLRDIMNDRPQSALDHAVWWAEYVMKHGGTQHLRPASAGLSWLQYYEVELVIIILVVAILFIGILSLIIVKVVRCNRKRRMYKRFSKII